MNNAKLFSSVLSRIRKEQGYSSAYRFFKSVGGSKSLGLAFMSYWDIERGKKLPRNWRLKAIMEALGIRKHSPEARELVRAYLKAFLGSDELLDVLSGPAPASADLPSRELAETAVQQALTQRRANLTIEQWKLCCRDMTTNMCHTFLVNTAGWVTVRELSDATGFKPETVRKTLKTLASGGLIDFSGNKARSPLVNKVVVAMPITPATSVIIAAARNHWNAWLKDCKLVGAKRMTVRMSKANMDIYRQHLEKAVNLSNIYENAGENRQDSAVYYIDARIFRIFPRE